MPVRPVSRFVPPALVGAALLSLTACPPAAPAELELSLEQLQVLGEGFVYEGWLIVDGAPLSTGRFTTSDGSWSESITLDEATLAQAERFVLTIEPEPDDSPDPAASHVLAGPFEDGVADLTIADPAALALDLSGAAGSYILETPTTSAVAEDYAQGIWFLDLSEGAPAASLVLPELAPGWTWEGWVVTADGPVSTGTFDSASGEDSDGPGAGAGPDGFPPFPGQDFISPALDVGAAAAVVISVEPVPDDSPAPFAIKPFVDDDVEDLGAGVGQSLELVAANAPVGTAVR